MGPYTANRRLYPTRAAILWRRTTEQSHAPGTRGRHAAARRRLRYGLTEEKAAAGRPPIRRGRKRPPIRARPSNAAPDRRRSAGAGR